MAKKRAAGDGSITYREGRKKPWLARTSKVAGRKVQTRNFATKAEAAAWLRQVNSDIDAGTHVDPNKLTVHRWMLTWLETYVKPTVRVRTYEGYESVLRCYIEPYIGSIELQRLTPADVQAMLNHCAEEGLSHRTLTYIIQTLRPALKQAMHDGLIVRNVAEAVKVPQAARKPAAKNALTSSEVRRLFDAIDNPRINIAVRVMAGTGVRIGELLALSWNDIDLSRGSISVRKAVATTRGQGNIITEPKTPASHRVIPVNDSLVGALQHWRKAQLEERMGAGPAWTDTDAVFTMPLGTRMRQEYISKHLRIAAREIGVTCSPHILRHTYASLLVENGVELKTVQELLGHTSSRMVMEVYAHSSDEAKRRTVDMLGF